MIPSTPVPMQFSKVVFDSNGTAKVEDAPELEAQHKRAEIAVRWRPSPPGTPEWEAQRNFDYARAHAHGDVKFLLEDNERLLQKYRKAMAMVLQMRSHVHPGHDEFPSIMSRINALLSESE